MSVSSSVSNGLLILLQVYFLLMNFTVERTYCHFALEDAAGGLLIKETIDFCKDNNKLFLLRPEWMVNATCISAYVFPVFYMMILVSAFLDLWHMKIVSLPLVLFLGAKVYAIFFYHYMEFTSAFPPENLVPYFSVEGPYLVSMALVFSQIYPHLTNAAAANDKKAK